MNEILAPAGSMESLVAAVRSGADAVYLGLKTLSARKNAENFSPSELKEAVKYCHRYGVKVHLAINTLITDKEWHLVEKAVETAVDCSVDAVIAADMGVIRYIRKTVPDLPVHASTQCTVFSSYGAETAKETGVERIVLGRELSEKEIKYIADNTDLQTEVFVHGALCMSVSGQCLFSSYLGGRSGNRGLCAGTCRLPFSSSAYGGEYALSLKDNSLIDEIDRLRAIGIDSYKIEGRMKRPEYVAAATYSLKSKLETGTYDKKLLCDVFSRSGFTKSYFEGKLNSDLFGAREKDDVISAPLSFSEIHGFYNREMQRVPVIITGKLTKDGLFCRISDGVNTVQGSADCVMPAENKPSDEKYIADKLSKLGGTPYYAKSVKIEITDGLYISASEVNELRRRLCGELSEKREAPIKRDIKDYEYSASPVYRGGINKKYVYADGGEIPPEFDLIIADPETAECYPPEKTAVAIPRYFSDLTVAKTAEKLKDLQSKGYYTAAADNINGIGLARKLGFKIIGTENLGVLNSESVRAYTEMGVSELILSTENSFSGVNHLKSSIPLGVVAYKYTPLMLTRPCPITKNRACDTCKVKGGTLTDRKGISFKVRCHKEYSEVLNSRPLCITDKLSEFTGAAIGLYDLRDAPDRERVIRCAFTNEKAADEYTTGLYDNKLL